MFEKEIFNMCKDLEQIFGGKWTFNVDHFRGEVQFYREVNGIYSRWGFNSMTLMKPDDPELSWQEYVMDIVRSTLSAPVIGGCNDCT